MRISEVIQFLKTGIWRVRRQDLSPFQSYLVWAIRIGNLTLRSLAHNRWQLRASALTYYSALSVVPIMAIAFGVAKGFGFESTLERVLVDKMQGQEEAFRRVIEFSRALLENVRGGLMAGISLIALFWTIFLVLSHIESAFNDIWGINRSRSFGRKITDYLALMIILPVFLIMSSTFTVFITSEVNYVVQRISLLGAIGPFIYFLLKSLPYLVIWLLFTYLYVFLPNKKIKLGSGLLAGIIAGSIYQIFQKTYILFQVSISKYNAIYGSFAALPLFFIWLNLSWLIVLLGAEISCAHQAVETYEFEPERLRISQAFEKLLSLRVVHLLIQRFSEGGGPYEVESMAQEMEVPIPLVQRILNHLVGAGVVSEVKTPDDAVVAYQPAIDPEQITIASVIQALESCGRSDIPLADSGALQQLSTSLSTFGRLMEESPANKRLKDI